MKKVLAECLKTYPDENDMLSFVCEEIEPCEVKIYHKGRLYKVDPDADKEYYKIINTDEVKSDDPIADIQPRCTFCTKSLSQLEIKQGQCSYCSFPIPSVKNKKHVTKK